LSPILVRPVREQLEHDRVIRLIQAARTKRKVEVAMNLGAEETAGVGAPGHREFPDLVVFSLEGGRRVQAVVEVETAESVNYLEALAQWAHYARFKVPFHLYVPAGSADAARRFCADHGIAVDELWTFHHVGEQVRFTLAQKSGASPRSRKAPSPGARPPAAPAPGRSGVAGRKAAPAARTPAAKRAAVRPPVKTKASGRRAARAKPVRPARKSSAAGKTPRASTAKRPARKATRRK